MAKEAETEFSFGPCTACGAQNAPHYKSAKSRRCVACYNAYQKSFRQRQEGIKTFNKDKRYAVKKRYGISFEQFSELGEHQRWQCAACGLKFDETQRAFKPHIDHCHKTGEVRGLLCNGCNRALGFIGDDAAIARKLADYLDERARRAERTTP